MPMVQHKREIVPPLKRLEELLPGDGFRLEGYSEGMVVVMFKEGHWKVQPDRFGVYKHGEYTIPAMNSQGEIICLMNTTNVHPFPFTLEIS